VRGAAHVILIDKVAERLSFAQSKIPGLEVIDNSKVRGCRAVGAAGLMRNMPGRGLSNMVERGAMTVSVPVWSQR